MSNDSYLSIKDVAERLKVAYLTVYRWIQSNKLPAYKAGKQYRVKEKDLKEFIKSYKK